ncbi:MAG: PEP-CTERM sorting domain-containing protein [Puniceicoccaceae bacterium]|nr:MAG: PEP-CTERM sorting domain-containing protein [Puniceicoccaceae bacterium]
MIHTSSIKRLGRLATALASLLIAGHGLHGQMASYYIGVDGLETIAAGAYAGLPNPNFGRLTFLYAHTYADNPANNHYHSKGRFAFTGPNLGAQTEVEVAASNFLPEGNRPPLLLSPGTGIYAGKLASNPYTDPADTNYSFSFLEIRDTGTLAGAAGESPESILFNSSGGRWTGSLADADVHLELVFLSPGLNIGSNLGINAGLKVPGDDLHLGDNFHFTPVFWTEADAPAGTYIAQFKLVDESGLWMDSGEFEFRFEVIPEPSTVALLLGGLVLGLTLVLRRSR